MNYFSEFLEIQACGWPILAKLKKKKKQIDLYLQKKNKKKTLVHVTGNTYIFAILLSF